MALIIAVVSASLAGSFLCSLCEAALYGVTPTQVELLRRSGAPGSERLAKLRRRIDEPIAGIAAFNSLAQTVGAAWTGALVGESYGNAWLGAVSAAFALTMLLLTEIIPKGIGLAWAAVLLGALVAGGAAAWRGDALVPAALPAMLGFLASGSLNTLIDAPRFLWLLLVLAGLAALRRPAVPAAPQPGGLVGAP